MGYAIPKGNYHKGPKKTTRKRKCHKPTFKPTEHATAPLSTLSATDGSLISVLTQMSDHDMTAFVTATTYPNPKDVVIVNGSNGRPKPIVLADSDSRQTHSGMVYVAGLGGFGGGSAPHHASESKPPIVAVQTFKPTAVKVGTPKTEQKEKVIGEIVRKPNGEIVLRFF